MAITIRSSFVVDAKLDVVWRSLTDIELSAPCFPGAELQEPQSDGGYKGAFTVKLGPLTLKFAGKFKIAAQNDQDHTMVVTASGTDTKGRGGADANIRVSVVDQDGKTQVDVVSDVNLSGSVAQYGRGAGMIEALSQQLLNQFAKNLTKLIEAPAANIASTSASASASTGASGAAPDPASTAAPASRPPAAPVVPLDAGSLVRQAMWQSIRNFFARLFGAK
ncbi:MAG TPA: SRPBCC family protein [Herbaspirillum sp.]|jgi:carbon monoxide dehydrogenase subunit G